ncbi:MAG: cobyric acid synthase, partial [Acidimicrobiales bacterium]
MSELDLHGAVMVCGTASNSGKSLLVAGLCRLLARRGVSVAPFKGQNMSLNSVVTSEGSEIGRAQGAQAEAAGIEPHVSMNPVLLKPTGDRTSQVVVMGKPWKVLDAAEFQRAKPQLRGIVLGALAELRTRYDVVVLEGAGSPAEINLMAGDLVNLGLADAAGVPALIVGDIDRGGVFAHLFGTVELLPDDLRRRVRGFVINKLRGDPALLATAPAQLEARTGVPTLGVIPWLEGITIDAEDSVALVTDSARGAPRGASDAVIDVAVIRFPRVSNFTDVDALACEPGVSVRWVEHPGQLAGPDLVVLPGTKSTVGDLDWFRRRGFDEALERLMAAPAPPVLLGVCGGYQMLGTKIVDEAGVE